MENGNNEEINNSTDLSLITNQESNPQSIWHTLSSVVGDLYTSITDIVHNIDIKQIAHTEFLRKIRLCLNLYGHRKTLLR
jgi:hypothetical protein